MRIKSFRNEKKKKYYFRVYNEQEDQILKSEAYNSKEARNNGIESFKANASISERYERKTAADGKFYFNIKAANHQVVATSLMFDIESEREATIEAIIAYATKSSSASAQKLAATPKTTDATVTSDTSKEDDDYMDVEFYETSGTDTTSGFDRFQKGDNNYHYFSFKSDDGKVLLLSQGYTQESGRDNGIASVEKNAIIESRYATHTTDDGKFFFTLKAGNHQEIAKSVVFDTEEAMQKAMAILMNGGGAMVETVAKAAPLAASGKEDDDYMEVEFYETLGTDTTSGFDRFQKGDNNYHYFSFKSDDGKVLLLSQGYTQESGRDNGIASVEKNATIESRYATHTTDDGKFFFTLKAGNHQEIAKSVIFDTEEAMQKAMIILMNGGGAMVETVAKAAPLAASGKEDDDYMEVEFYETSGTDTTSGFDRFQKGDNNYHYFSFKSDDGKVLLLSQGYTQESGRNNGIASVEKNATIESRYATHKTDDGKFFFTLKAGNHQEIAKSVVFDTEEAMQKAMAILMNGGGAMVETVAKAAPQSVSADSRDLDDYRTFGFYRESGTGVENGWDKFYSEKHNEYYFCYKMEGEPIFISEGYTTAKARDNGVNSVMTNWNKEARYKVHETAGGRFYWTLKAGNHQEIARSKWYMSAEERDAGMAWVMAAGVGGVAMKATPVVEENVVETEVDVQDDYLPCEEYEGHEVNDKVNNVAFFKHENGQFYFVVYKEDGSVRLRSEGFKTAKDRDVELSGVLKNLNNPEMYETIERGKYRIHILRDQTGREVGRSCLETETVAVPVVETATAAALAAAAVTAEEAVETEVDVEDDYLACKEYEGHEVNDKVNNVAFFKHENGQFYFVVYKEDGSVRLRSEGFKTAKDRDVELSGVLKNLNNPEMYETIERGKYRIHILRDQTGREVGRSCLETETVAVPVVETATAAAALAAAAVTTEEVVETEVDVEDDYLACKEYEGHEVNDKVNNVAFFKHENGQFYFVVYKEDGSVRLRSEGFKTAKDRDVELSGVLKNLNNADMYETIERGKYRIHILRDQTGREVGRSCLETETVAVPVVETATAAAAVAAAAVTTEEVVETEVDVEDDYLACKEYEGHEVNDKVNNVAFFKHENGQFYFVVYKEDGSVRLRSEGFRTAKDRDVELSGVLKNLNNPDMYETIERGKYRIHILRDDTGREVGRSCLEKEEAAAAIPVVETATAAAALAAAAVTVEEVVEPEVVETEVDVEDDYLPCKEYEGHKVNDKVNNVAFFKHENGQYYFAIYKEDGSVRLRSEGFRTAKKRDSELSGALKNLNNPDQYETIERGKYKLHILKDDTGREVGRSCLETEDVAAFIPLAGAAAAAAFAGAALVTDEPDPVIEVEEEVVAPVVVEKTAEKVVAAAPVIETASEAASSGFKWWWLLPLLLIPLFFLLRGCDGCGKTGTTTSAPPPVEKPTEKVTPPIIPADTTETPVDTVDKVTTAPVPDPTCNCTGSENIIFNIPTSGTPKVLTRLGTNPEFGNSHSLDPTGFYNKLKRAYDSNARDKRFLNRMFKAMGYNNGFADAKPNLFSNARVSVGTVGNMGYSPKHRTVYAKLNTSGRDLEAFKIKAANGCDIHFMKTCGNHFFFCDK